MVAAAFTASFVVFGVSYSFGVFFKPMAAEFHASRTATSAFFPMTGFVSYMLAPATGHLSDPFGPRIVVGTGAIVMGMGLVLTAFIGHMWVGYLTYGVGVELGHGEAPRQQVRADRQAMAGIRGRALAAPGPRA